MSQYQPRNICSSTKLDDQVQVTVPEAKRKFLKDLLVSASKAGDMLAVEVKPFRLLDLPPELRARIFGFAVRRRYTLDLRYPGRPSLTKASRQLRQESLPIYFAENAFLVPYRITTHEYVLSSL